MSLAMERMDFSSPDNQAGQTLLRIVSRGSSIIAELLRLSTYIPEVFLGGDKVKDPEQRKYLDVLVDFSYLRDPEDFEKKLMDNPDLADLDREFLDNHQEILDRFYKLFESIWKYQADITKYVEDVNNGYYLQHSLDNILQDIAGRQLLAEVLYLWGIILLTLEEKVPGFIRERMLIALYRLNGEVGLENFEAVCKLCRNSGFIPGPEGKRPKNHPDAFMGRFPMNAEFVRLVIGRLQTDDIYLMANSYPSPEHRSTRLANQAGMLYIILYFAPDILNNSKATMREIIDKYFNDNWVIATYMGQVVDLTAEWAPYPAAKAAIDAIITPSLVKSLHDSNVKLMSTALKGLNDYLREGLLTQEYMLDHLEVLMNCLRNCNIALRWRILHRKCKNENYRKLIESNAQPQAVVQLLLNASQLEYTLKTMLQQLLNEKDMAWTDGKAAAADRMVELSEYFTGEKALARVKRDENLMKWFSSLAEEVKSLNLVDSHATATGRRIQGIIKALEDVEQFEAVDTNIQIKTFLHDAREIFRTMIRTVNIRNEILNIVDAVSDLSYAWQTLTDYIPIFQERITKDPKSVVLLRAVFLKAASMLDVPLVRIAAIDSPDAVSVAAYYSQELVEFVRTVLGIIPVSVFNILGQIVSLQTDKMQPIPIRLEAKDLKDYAQLDARFELARLTHEVSIFTEGILVMEKTLLGVIQVDPRQILEEGLRRELVRKLSYALHQDLLFPNKDFSRKEIYESMNRVANKLDGFKRSIEYLQDYISIAGLKIFQQEFSRTINYNTEQEANRFIKKKIFDSASRYQNKKIPIPKLIQQQTNGLIDTEDSSALTFMGRIMCAMLALTDPTRTIYAPECSAWFEHPAPDQKVTPTIETCGIRTFALLEKSIGVCGLRGIDRLLSFRTVNTFTQFLKYYSQKVHPYRALLDQVRTSLFPEYRVPTNASKIYTTAMKKIEGLLAPLLIYIRKIGQGQLIRRQIANVLQFGCQLDAHLLYQALDTFNQGLVNDIRQHYSHPETKPYPEEKNPLFYETTVLLEACGLDDPIQKIYITSQPLEGLPVLLFLFLLAYLPKLEYDSNFGALIRKKSKFPLDGIPLAIGLACLLKQFHPSYTRQLFAYLGQFIRSNLQELFQEVDHKPQEVPRELLNTLLFMEQVCQYSSIPRVLVHEFVPPYIFDALKYSAAPIKK